jgi:integrase
MAVSKRGKRWGVRVYRNGRHEYIGTFGSRTEAKEAERKALDRKRISDPRLTCAGFAESWVENYPRPKDSTNDTNRQAARVFARDFAGQRLSTVTRPEAREWARRRPAYHSQVRAMFADALNDGLVAENPFANLRLPKSRGRRDLVVLAPAELTEVADAASCHGDYGPHYRAMILFAAYTGVRPGELFALEWDDIDRQRMEIRVERRIYRGSVDLPKNGKKRTIILPPPALAALDSMPRRVHAATVFANKRGGRLSQATNHWYWNPVRIAVGRPKMAFYEMRHFAATHLLELGCSPADVAVQLGHTDGGALVMRLYGHPDQDRARERLRRAFDTPAELSVVRERKAADG